MSELVLVSTDRSSLDLLVVEDHPGDALLVLELLTDADLDASVRHVWGISEALHALAAKAVDCVLLDLDLPDAHGLDGLQRIMSCGFDAPIIVLTGNDDRQLGQRAVAMGAQDYLLKGRIDSERIGTSIRHAIDRHQTLRALEASERRVRSMFECVPVPQLAIDLDGCIVEVNAAACVALVRDADDLLGRRIDELLYDPHDAWHDRINGLLASGQATMGPIEHRIVAGDGSVVHVKATTSLVFDHTGHVTQLVVLAEDITVQRRVERELRAVLARYDGLFEGTHDGVWMVDAAGVTVTVNERMAEMVGYVPSEMIGRHVTDFVAENDRPAFEDRFARRRAGITSHAQARYQHREGWLVDVHLTGRPMLDDDGRFVGVIALVSDVTGQRRAEQALRMSEARFRAIVANLSDVVTIHDRDGTIKWVSPSAATVTGFAPETLIGIDALDRVHPDDRALLLSNFQSVIRGGSPNEVISFRTVHSDGGWRELEAMAVNLLDDPAVEGVVVTARDSTERRQAERMLAAQALQDPLTELPNRTLFFDRLRQALARAGRTKRPIAVMFLDIDRFKTINDSLGHDIGDELLRAIGALLESAVRPGDTVARLGGDEFVVCCDRVDSEIAATAVATRLAQRLAVPFCIGGHSFRVTASIGIALSSIDRHSTAEALVRVADAAMYRVKSRGGDGFEIAAEDLDDRLRERFETEERLRSAIDDGQLRVHYQPEVDLRTEEVVGFEALVRWDDPVKGLVPPSEFIPLAEDTGLIAPLGQFVLETACGQLVQWHRRQPDDAPRYQLSVNLSGRQLARPTIVDEVAHALASTGMDPDALWLEITETTLMGDVETASDTLQRLRSLGVHLAVDDFGTGWSSLLYLRRFPVELLKIDRSFVSGVLCNHEDTSIVTAVVGLARSLGLRAIAEGVETEAQRDALLELGCAWGQGYLWCAPQPAAELERRLWPS